MNKIYVLAEVIGPVCASTDLEALKRRAEKKEHADASEFKWERVDWAPWTMRLSLHYVSKSTGQWIKSHYYIDKVPLLDTGEEEE